MIDTETVFVLGAGASAHLAYPLGDELREQIIEGLSSPGSPRFRELSELDFTNKEITSFVNDFRYSGVMSIDAFLEHRRKFLNVGKCAIAQALIPRENLGALFPSKRTKMAENWYQYIYRFMNTGFDDFHENKISFITFNYDRSLEHFLFTALSNTYGKNEVETAGKLMPIKILHIHGFLDYLPWQSPEGREYHSKYTLAGLNAAAAKIKIIHETCEDKVLKEANDLLLKAKRIYFLGFGYDYKNMDKLGLDEPNPLLNVLQGAAVGMEKAQLYAVRNYFKGKINLCDSVSSVVEFLKKEFIQ